MEASVSVTQWEHSVHCMWTHSSHERRRLWEDCGCAPPSRSRIVTSGLICPQEAAVPAGKGPVFKLETLGFKA